MSNLQPQQPQTQLAQNAQQPPANQPQQSAQQQPEQVGQQALQAQQEDDMIEYRFQHPKIANCGECPLMYDYIYCGADVDNTASIKHSEKIDGNDYFFTMSDEDKRPNWCPLKEVIENASLADELAAIALYYLERFYENERFLIEDYGGTYWQSKINDLEAEYQLKKYRINEFRKRLSND